MKMSSKYAVNGNRQPVTACQSAADFLSDFLPDLA